MEYIDYLIKQVEEAELKQKTKKPKIPKKIMQSGLTILPLPTNKHKIKVRHAMEDGVIPTHASSVIFNGRSGSGKTNLMVNLLIKPQFYGADIKTKKRYFDKIYLFSPTADGGDDLARFIQPDEIHTDFNVSKLTRTIEKQAKLIKEKGLLKSPKILFIFDDIQSDAPFMRTKAFLRCFIQCRHLNISTFLCGQSWTKTPRACRLQANNIFMFPASQSEVELLSSEFSPPGLTKIRFKKLIEDATEKRYNFLHINMRKHPKERFRHNLDTILSWD